MNEKLQQLVSERNALLEKEDNKEIDSLAEQILNYIKENKNQLNVEDMVEAISSLGHAPSILYDDNGYFAVCGEGGQNLISEMDHHKETVLEGFWQIEANGWKKTIREALYFYLGEK